MVVELQEVTGQSNLNVKNCEISLQPDIHK